MLPLAATVDEFIIVTVALVVLQVNVADDPNGIVVGSTDNVAVGAAGGIVKSKPVPTLDIVNPR